MVFLYYTGAEQFNFPQIDPLKSLGGNISSSLIANQSINNLFGSISNFSLQKKTSDTKIIALKNSLNADLLNFKFYYTLDFNSQFDYEFAFVKPTQDGCGNLIFEKLNNSESSPYYASFITPDPKDFQNEVNLSSFEKNSYLGLFIRRKIKQDSIQSSISNTCVAQDLSNIDSQIEKLSLNFSWD